MIKTNPSVPLPDEILIHRGYFDHNVFCAIRYALAAKT